MKRLLIYVAAAAAMGTTIAAPSDERAPFYMAMSASRDATALFFLDEMLTARCGKQQSIDHLRVVSGATQLSVAVALRDGDVARARTGLAMMKCEAH